MAIQKTGRLAKAKASVKKMQQQGENLVHRIRREAATLITKSRSEALRDLRAARKELQGRADRAVRNVERKIVTQLHAATETQVKKLALRITKLEQQVAALNRKRYDATGKQAA
jgi:hypothetical protein